MAGTQYRYAISQQWLSNMRMWQEFSEIQSPRLRSTTLNSYSPQHVKQHGESTLFCNEDLLRRDSPTCIYSARRGFCERIQVTSVRVSIQGCGLFNWWTLGDLNPRPLGCKPSALPAELSAPIVWGKVSPF